MKKNKPKAFKPNDEYRLFAWVNNLYMNQLQKGLQTAHVVGELFNKYGIDSDTGTWARECKTIIIYDGTNHGSLEKWHRELQKMEKQGMPYEYAKFNEDKESLNGACTCVGMILPKSIFTLVPDDLDYVKGSTPKWMQDLVEKRSHSRLTSA